MTVLSISGDNNSKRLKQGLIKSAYHPSATPKEQMHVDLRHHLVQGGYGKSASVVSGAQGRT